MAEENASLRKDKFNLNLKHIRKDLQIQELTVQVRSLKK